MSRNKLDLLDTSNDKHRKMIKEYEQRKGIKLDLDIINNSNSNELNAYIYSSDEEKIKDICLIQCQKDIKTATIINIDKDTSKTILPVTSNYLINTLGMESVFIRVDMDDKQIMKYLEEKGFESLGDENGDIIYLREKVSTITKERTM